MVTRSMHPLSRRFLSSVISPVIARTFPFARKLTRTSSLEFKGIFTSVTLSLQYNPGLWDSCLSKPRQSLNRSSNCVEVLGNMVVEINKADM